ncbi:PilN domain-containing protein [Tardiphaga sp.]|uniref:PilN domain-containing protein n=1 Tax=Tardiphaga sp. TaxID=1926292 RepID=UPI00261C6442|nr:PilN domain-containing protein [Tardiphaga sp.]MDB5617779.1 hypothetical protein [Tardiphaga sp.]
MKFGHTLGEIVSAWTGTVAGAIVAGFDRLVSPRVLRLIEDDRGNFTIDATGSVAAPAAVDYVDGRLSGADLAPRFRGSRVELVLQPRRFLFRPLELPARAADFLDGIVRAQIDRLTPWSATDAVFGCSPPIPSAPDSITTVVAATTRKVAMSYVEAMSDFHPASVAICAGAGEHHLERIKVFEQKARGHLDADRLGRGLRVGLGLAAIAAVASAGVAAFMSDRLDAQQDELARKISQRRAIIRASSDGGTRSPAAALEQRKFAAPASVLVLDTLSQVLPDHTYVTELHLAGSKLQIAGITRDAPSLIPLIEQSAHFTRATFYAPTTRSPSDPGERFHIEARIEPKNAAQP